MASFAMQRTLEIAARALLVAAVAMPCYAHAQRSIERDAGDRRTQIARIREEPPQEGPRAENSIGSFEPGSGDSVEQITESIRERQRRDGHDSEDLIGPLHALAVLHAENEDYALAGAAIERARQVVKVNRGLRSLEEAALVRQAVRIAEARGDSAAAWELEQELLALLRRHRGDLRTIPFHHEIGDRRMNLLRRYLAGGFPPEIVLGCYYNTTRIEGHSCTAGSRGAVVRAILREAHQNYNHAIRTLIRHERYSSGVLRELEMKVLRSNYRHGGYYKAGQESLRRLLEYDVASQEPLEARVDALVQVADWDLLFSKFGSAVETYEQAYQHLKREGVDEAAIEQIFSPPLPVVLPAFLPNPLASEETSESTGHVDVAFEITRFGKSRQVEILESTTNAPKDAASNVADLIKGSRFRPRVTDGEFAGSSRLFVRYYLND